MTNNYQEATQAIQEADAIIILAGAGMGVDSKRPTVPYLI
jgi:NAD-dependent SIR2 family protein deacetylase